MKWKKLAAYAIESGKWVICRSLVEGKERFTLWKGETRVKDFDTAEEAKEAAKCSV